MACIATTFKNTTVARIAVGVAADDVIRSLVARVIVAAVALARQHARTAVDEVLGTALERVCRHFDLAFIALTASTVNVCTTLDKRVVIVVSAFCRRTPNKCVHGRVSIIAVARTVEAIAIEIGEWVDFNRTVTLDAVDRRAFVRTAIEFRLEISTVDVFCLMRALFALVRDAHAFVVAVAYADFVLRAIGQATSEIAVGRRQAAVGSLSTNTLFALRIKSDAAFRPRLVVLTRGVRREKQFALRAVLITNIVHAFLFRAVGNGVAAVGNAGVNARAVCVAIGDIARTHVTRVGAKIVAVFGV